MPTNRLGSSTQAIYSARLDCGSALAYEAATFVPAVGEVVPCRRHGFCPVTSRDGGDGRGVDRVGRTTRRRSLGDLMAFMNSRPVTTLHALRHHRFTLRLLSAAQNSGLLDLDLATGRVTLARPSPAMSAAVGRRPDDDQPRRREAFLAGETFHDAGRRS
ncbi:hypothetical protein [Geodermatophilus sp. URMC 64]